MVDWLGVVIFSLFNAFRVYLCFVWKKSITSHNTKQYTSGARMRIICFTLFDLGSYYMTVCLLFWDWWDKFLYRSLNHDFVLIFAPELFLKHLNGRRIFVVENASKIFCWATKKYNNSIEVEAEVKRKNNFDLRIDDGLESSQSQNRPKAVIINLFWIWMVSWFRNNKALMTKTRRQQQQRQKN